MSRLNIYPPERVTEFINGISTYPIPFCQSGKTCMAYAVVYCIELHRSLYHATNPHAYNNDRKVSVEHILDDCYQVDQMTGEVQPKADIAEILKFVTVSGVAYIDAYLEGRPFRHDGFYCTRPWVKLGDPQAVDTLETVRDYVLNRGPLLVIFEITEEYEGFDGRSIYGVARGGPDREVSKVPCHISVVTGITRHTVTKEAVLEITNTHGPHWGFGGRCYVFASAVLDYYIMI